jgi:hypothetical protein
MGFSSSNLIFGEKFGGGARTFISWTTMRNIGQAREVLRKLENPEEDGGWLVKENGWNVTSITQYSWRKQDEIKEWLHGRIKEHEIGRDVYISHKDFSDSGCSVIM